MDVAPTHVAASCTCPRPGRGRVGPMWDRLRAAEPQTCPKSNPNDPDQTSDNPKLQPHELQTHPYIGHVKASTPAGVPARPEKPRNCGFDCGLGMGPVFSRFSATVLVLQCRWHQNSARQTTSQTMSCRKKTPVRLDSTSLGLRPLLAMAGAASPLRGCRCCGCRCAGCWCGLLRAEKRIPCGSVWISGTSPGALRGKVVGAKF
jgi:hypothetical protein